MELLKKIRETILKQTFLAFVFVVCLLVGFAPDVSIKTGLNIVAFEAIALWLVYLVLYVFTPINFIEELKNALVFYSENDEKRAFVATYIICSVFISVHLLCGLVVWGVYFTNYRPIP